MCPQRSASPRGYGNGMLRPCEYTETPVGPASCDAPSPISVGHWRWPKVRPRRREAARSSTATSARSSPKTASNATASMKRPARPSCGSTWPTPPSPNTTTSPRSSPATPNRAKLWRRITTDDEAEMMPPPDSHRQLKPRAKGNAQALDRAGGALRQALVVHPAGEGRAPRSLRQNLAAQRNRSTSSSHASTQRNLQPSPEADRRTLIRRLSLDLTGLPPTAAEVEAFVADQSAGRLRKTRRSPPRQPPLRRTHGPRLARRRPLRRHQRLLDRRRPPHVAVARLGHQRLQHATCPTTSSSANNSPATCCPTTPKPSSSPPASSATT